MTDSLSRCYNIMEIKQDQSALDYIRTIHLEFNHPGITKLKNTIKEFESLGINILYQNDVQKV